MLETLRRNSRSAIIYVLFGILIAVFVLSFGPGNRGFTPQNAASNTAAKVAGSTLSEQDFRFAYLALGGSQIPPQVAKERRLKEFVMDKLIERELLATEAERLGFLVSAKEVEDMITDGRMMLMGFPRKVDSYVYKDGNFDYERFKMVCQNQLGVSVMRFIEIQRRELLADKMRESLKVGVRVSPAEVKGEFEEHGRQVNLEFVRFSTHKFDTDEEPSAADLMAYEKAHEAELKKLYEDRKPLLFTKIDRQAKLRHVSIEVAKDAAADVVAKAKAKIDDAKKQVDGGTAFPQVAQQYASSDVKKSRHGVLGWKKKGFTGLGEALDGKIFALDLKKGAVIGPERTERGWELVLVEDFREGDISYEQAVPELAEAEMLKSRAKEKAKAEAQAALDRVKKGEKLETLFPAKADGNDKDKSPEASLARMMGGANDAPQLKETGLFSRRGEMIQEIGVSKDLAQKAFDLPAGEVSGPYEVAGSYVIVRVKDKKEPDLKDFDKRRTELERESARGRWFATVDAWSKQRCVELRDAGRIKVNDDIVAYDGVPATRPGKLDAASLSQLGLGGGAYAPCSNRAAF